MIKNTPTPAEFIHRTGSVLGKAPSVACPGASTCRSPLKGAEMDGRNGGKRSGTLGSSNLPRHRGELVKDPWLLVAHSWWNASYLVLKKVVDEESTDEVSSENPFHS